LTLKSTTISAPTLIHVGTRVLLCSQSFHTIWAIFLLASFVVKRGQHKELKLNFHHWFNSSNYN